MADIHSKREEFIVWLKEVKNLNIESISNVEEKKRFDDFAEDYNTATFPSKKYYDLKRWELKEALKALRKKKQGEQVEKTTFEDEKDIA